MDGSLSDSSMNSLPTATTPRPADDTEVLSQRLPEQGEATLETPQGEIPDAGHMGSKIPTDYAYESRSKLGSRLDTVRNLQRFRIQAGSPSLRRASHPCR